jgi:Arc/MetJ family transcription regulator
MKTTVDIPKDLMEDAMKLAGAKTKREAVVTAIADYVRRQRIASLRKHLGTCKNLLTSDELRRFRETT